MNVNVSVNVIVKFKCKNERHTCQMTFSMHAVAGAGVCGRWLMGRALAVVLAVTQAMALTALGKACCGGDLRVGHGMLRSR